MASFRSIPGNTAVTMIENGRKRPIRAGQAFMAAIADDPQAQQSLAKATLQLRAFAAGIKAIGVTHRQVMESIGRVFAVFNEALKETADAQESTPPADLAALRTEQERAFAELAEVIQTSQGQMKADLAAHGFDPPQDLEDWEGLARLAEKEPGPMTIVEIYDWAIAWAKRESLRLKIARGETSVQTGDTSTEDQPATLPEDIGIRRDENDPRFAWCMGKRIYLGRDSQIARLFWLLASPIGRACTLAEVQRAVDGFETDRDRDTDGDGFKQASQRVRKAMSKLRQALRDAELDDHLLIVRGGSAAFPEYTMVQRFPK